jgi:hypothetical protein
MYNTVNIIHAAMFFNMDGGDGLKLISWKIPGVPFDPKHGHQLFLGSLYGMNMRTETEQVI